jgi:hypothetical protein
MASFSSGDPLLLSPPIPVEWCGFESDTRRMQACGWEFAVNQDVMRREVEFIARHRRLATFLVGRLRDDDIRQRSLVYFRQELVGFKGPPLQFTSLTQERNTQFVHLQSSIDDFTRVDMNSEYTTIQEQRWNGDTIDLFRKWAPKSEEIIVAPETVADLFERIKKMQSPELAEIRERNRKRDIREQRSENVVAQIITLAA